MRMAWVLACGLAAAPAMAKNRVKTHTRSPHHCVGKNGEEVPNVHKRECRAQGNKWKKLRPATGAPNPVPPPAPPAK